MSLTSNFDFCVEISLEAVKAIFHLALKSEERYPHNVDGLPRTVDGHAITVDVHILDDDDRPADLRFADDTHIAFSFPFDVIVHMPDAPDPSLTSITMQVRVEVPALLTSWKEPDPGGTLADVLGLSFEAVTAGDVDVQDLQGLPAIDAERFAGAIHSRYGTIPHTYSAFGGTLLLYDGDRDATLSPTNQSGPPRDITVALVTHGGAEYLQVTAPIHVDVSAGALHYVSYGHVLLHRPISRTATSITVDMTAEPTDAALKTVVTLDNAGIGHDVVVAQLQPLVVQALSGFGVVSEPAYGPAAAHDRVQQEVAAYLRARRYPVYSPRSGDPDQPLATPKGFLLFQQGVLAILLNRRGDPASDAPPDDFLGTGQLALAVGRAKVDEIISSAIQEQFPDLPDHPIHTADGDATLHSVHIAPADAGDHGQDAGHLWTTGSATVEIDCWPDPDVSFEGPIFVDATHEDTPDGCVLTLEPRVGDFGFDEDCCHIFLDLIIFGVGWVMLAVTHHLINQVGGELAASIASGQGETIQAIPPVVNGIAQVSACLDGLQIRSQGFVFPGSLTIRRLDTSFEDVRDRHQLPGP